MMKYIFTILLLALCSGTSRPKIIKEDAIIMINERVHNINAGGCGYFAYTLYQKIDKSRYSIVSINDLAHICLYEYETGYFIDSRGYHSLAELELMYSHPPYTIKEISEKYLDSLLRHFEIWNPRFDRKDTCVIKLLINKL